MINLMENSTKVELPSAVEYSYSITTAINVGGRGVIQKVPFKIR